MRNCICNCNQSGPPANQFDPIGSKTGEVRTILKTFKRSRHGDLIDPSKLEKNLNKDILGGRRQKLDSKEWPSHTPGLASASSMQN